MSAEKKFDDFKQDVKCSLCKWTESKTTDNYIIFRVNYAADTVLKLVNKMNMKCNYNEENVIIECEMDQKTIEPFKSCIVGQCLKQQIPGFTKENGNVVTTSKEVTINPGYIGPAVAGGIFLGILIGVCSAAFVNSRKIKPTICCQKLCTERCCSVSSLTSARNSDRGENASAASSRPVEMSVYEAIPDKNVYDHLHEKPKTTPKPGRYSTMKEIREIRQTMTDETFQPVEKENVKLGVKTDDENKNNTFQIRQQSAEGDDDGKRNLDEMQSMGPYFILEKTCPEEKDVIN
ncbi:uncharacterized protein LOC134281811 isoform X2 [Saccostrea cucullata]|uniref:uncharacterized protein LOC134281811 isoform X2 n=1 Tax=Saccostrea cuccullata TaxID=36930 RepID=UPI002ED605EF